MNNLSYTHYYNLEKDLGIPIETTIEITDQIIIATKYIDIYNIKEVVEEANSYELPDNLWNEIEKLDLESLEDKYFNERVSSSYKVVLNNKVIEGNYFPDKINDLRYLLNVKEIIKAESLRIQEKLLKGEE